MDNNYSVYKHTFPNGKIYIGITGLQPEKRWRSNGSGYTGKNKDGKYKQPYIGKAVSKYGWSNIEHEILFDNLTKEEAEQKEIELIAFYKSNQIQYGYNIQNGGNTTGTHSEETKRKIGNSRVYPSGENSPFYGKRHTEEAKKKISNSNKGKILSEEHKKKLSEVFKGENHPSYGKHRSEETKNKIREAKNKAVRCVETGNVFISMKYAEIETGIAHGNISDCCRGRHKTAGGYHWEFVEKR